MTAIRASPARVALVVLLIHGAWIGLFIGLGHDPIEFVHVGVHQLQRSTSSAVISGLAHNPHVNETIGNDGQFAYYMSLDPVHARAYVDHDSYRYARFLYPLLARVLSFGQAGAIPTVLLVLNLAAVAGGALAVALWLARRGLSPWLALFYGLFPGMIFSLRFDFTEPVAPCRTWGVSLGPRRCPQAPSGWRPHQSGCYAHSTFSGESDNGSGAGLDRFRVA